MYRIREIREDKRMTTAELARRAGVSRRTIYLLENNHTEVAMSKTLLGIARALDVSIGDLFLSDDVQSVSNE